MTLPAGVRLGPYEIVAPIGAGGMGEVYRARDTRLGRDVAVKVLPADLATDPDRLRRFELEARAVAALSHPNILALHDVGTHDGAPFLVSELLEGETLADALHGGALSVGKAVDVGIQIAKGLAAAHARSIVHRDLKPSNVFLTRDGHVKLLDFGIAKHGTPAAQGDDVPTATARDGTDAGTRLGTMGYMSPEQVRGHAVDPRTDIFAFGCVLYEMLCGLRAFKGATAADTISAILKEDPAPLGDLRQSVSPALQQVVDRCLEKRPENRFSSAHDLALALGTVSTGPGPARPDTAAVGTGATVSPAAVVTGGVPQRRSAVGRLSASVSAHRWIWLLGCLVVLVAIVVSYPVVVRQRQLSWVRNQALPELVRLVDAGENWPAFLLARRIQAVVPGEPTVEKLRPRFAGQTLRQFRPAGATLLARPLTGGDADWVELGKVGGKPVPAPLGYSVFRLQAPGYESREFAMSVYGFGFDTGRIEGTLSLQRPGEAPAGMVLIETPAKGAKFGLESLGAFNFAPDGRIGSFFVDAREVTNREFKQFLDKGGYQQRDYWREPFERDGKTLTWDEAMSSFRDATGRPGPAGWQVGSYEPGTDDYPVTGVSWYEASAYAAFAGKRLPSIYHLAVASARFVGGDILPGSNFSGKLAPVGSYRGGLNYWGLFDAAGNAREWCSNIAGRERFALGGAAGDPRYLFWNVDDNTRSAFDRNPTTGFRCIKTIASNPQDVALDGPLPRKPPTDWAKVKGFSDDAWMTWQGLLAYTKGELRANVEWREYEVPSRRIEKVTFNAASSNERVILYLFLPDPQKWPPPWQPVIFIHPGFGRMQSSSQDGHNTMDLGFWEYLVRDGRAVVYPVFKDMFERGGGPQNPGDWPWSTWQERAKDVFRAIDYLETRKDLRSDRLGLLAASGGSDGGIVVCAVEPRIKAAVLVGGGLYGIPSVDREMMGFASHISMPLQMVNGRSDAWGQDFLLAALATPSDRRRFKQFDGDHSLAGYEKDVIRVNLEWFDKYLGKVR